MKTTEASGAVQEFSFLAPDALSVLLVGDFTHWQNDPISLQKGSDGIWRTAVPLGPGVHHYKFVVDGQWPEDAEYTVRIREAPATKS
ncbi:MAG: glycoside hydrolase [Verrucomicrobia bacterium]|nr:glycoside hydrolase [Verrucomicrobiota bacterium]